MSTFSVVEEAGEDGHADGQQDVEEERQVELDGDVIVGVDP